MPVIAEDLRQFLESTLLAIAALLPIVNPLGAAPVYLAKTVDLTPAEHADLSRRVAINCFMLLLASLLVGAYVLDFFDLSVPIVQVAGGLVVCSLAWSLLNQPDEPIEWVHEAAKPLSRPDLRTRAFYPLTMPLTVGPGSISVAITIGANQSQQRSLADRQLRRACNGHLRRRAFGVRRASLRRHDHAQARPDRHGRTAAAVRVHPAVHRRADHVEWRVDAVPDARVPVVAANGGRVARIGYNSARFPAGVAQLVEQRIRNAKVEGSTPSTGTIKATVLD